MNRGLYTSAIGMITQMNKMDVVTNNIANVDTTAFKGDTTVIQSFSEELVKILDDPEARLIKQNNKVGNVTLGNFISNINTNFTTGSFEETGDPYDLSIEGDGFFVIEIIGNDGSPTEKYTRDGSFAVNSSRELVTTEGYYVLGENGRITIPDGNFTVTKNGDIYTNGEFVDKIKLTNFENKDSLRKYGENLYNKTEESIEQPFNSNLLQRHVESSNVNVVKEMVKLITVSRIYEVNQKMVKAHDEVLGKAVTEIARK